MGAARYSTLSIQPFLDARHHRWASHYSHHEENQANNDAHGEEGGLGGGSVEEREEALPSGLSPDLAELSPEGLLLYLSKNLFS